MAGEGQYYVIGWSQIREKVRYYYTFFEWLKWESDTISAGEKVETGIHLLLVGLKNGLNNLENNFKLSNKIKH